MWKSVSLTYLEYAVLSKTIEDFLKDIDNLRKLQVTGHVPLILAEKKESFFHITSAPNTLALLSQIDERFDEFNNKAIPAIIDFAIIESHDLLLGNKETFKKKIFKERNEWVNEICYSDQSL